MSKPKDKGLIYSGRKKEPRILQKYPGRDRTGVKRVSKNTYKGNILRSKRPRMHARPWKLRTRFDQRAALENRAAQNIRGSLPERIFYKALTDRGFVEGADFTFQLPEAGGRQAGGGLLPDFVFPQLEVIVQVQSHWHTLSLRHTRRDDEQTLILESFGYTVLEIWQEEIEDSNKLDDWINRNLMYLWGTNHQNLGTPAPAKFDEIGFHWIPVLYLILVKSNKILGLLRRFF